MLSNLIKDDLYKKILIEPAQQDVNHLYIVSGYTTSKRHLNPRKWRFMISFQHCLMQKWIKLNFDNESHKNAIIF